MAPPPVSTPNGWPPTDIPGKARKDEWTVDGMISHGIALTV
jgi:hypothetical protein